MRRFILLAALFILGGCAVGISLAPPPNLYRTGANYPDDLVPEVWRTAEPKIFYMTNRQPDGASYGASRSDSMAFGAATVKFGRDLGWEELLERTRADSDQRVSTLWVPELEEVVRFEATPLPYARNDGRLTHLQTSLDAYNAQAARFQAVIADEIRQTGNRSLLVYVHGFNSEFEDSLTTLANMWHFAGRESVPISFTWPAGNGFGPLGYFRDRDAGVFSVHHTKEFLRMLADMPEVDSIDIIAHSRGTDVVTTALRELMIEARGAGVHPKEMLKTGTLIMAAPDLDVGIVRQRLQAERFSEAFEQVNLYINPDDAALRISALLTRSTRLGALRNEDFAEGELELLRDQALVHFIRVENVRGGFGHSYFRENPAVLSDVVLALRTRTFPGGSLRPLDQDEDGIWVLHPNYPLERLPDLVGLEARAARREER
ncbi:alpha/beta hydrolase [Tateyamaria sp. ANG-S1]|uniref:alpha/beta hydrolase n=1 Tax=Tateyamaria sp. ANG-S1 TaxID=1577905 RepID=UPI00068B55D3|nr:alpha/beta hydrolase [Tateyamaria sp. ANG-S1]